MLNLLWGIMRSLRSNQIILGEIATCLVKKVSANTQVTTITGIITIKVPLLLLSIMLIMYLKCTSLLQKSIIKLNNISLISKYKNLILLKDITTWVIGVGDKMEITHQWWSIESHKYPIWMKVRMSQNKKSVFHLKLIVAYLIKNSTKSFSVKRNKNSLKMRIFGSPNKCRNWTSVMLGTNRETQSWIKGESITVSNSMRIKTMTKKEVMIIPIQKMKNQIKEKKTIRVKLSNNSKLLQV